MPLHIWNQIVVSIEGKNGMRNYLNGWQISEKRESAAWEAGSTQESFEVCRSYKSNTFQLDCDELAVYSRAYGADEVRDLYES